MRSEIQLTDEQVEKIFESAFGACVTIDSLGFSREELVNFDKNMSCIERDKPFHSEENGFATVEIRNVKQAKGKPRQDVLVVDFGSVRAIYQG